MDKAHLNNCISKLKGSAKESIRRMLQKIKKNETKLIELSEKVKDEKKLNKIKNQIERFKKEKEIIKQLCPDEITKIGLVIQNSMDLLNCDELSLEEKLKIRISNTDILQKMIQKFRQDFPGCEMWIDVTIDLLDQKKIMKSYKNKELVKKLDSQMKQRRNILKQYRIRNGIVEQVQNNESVAIESNKELNEQSNDESNVGSNEELNQESNDESNEESNVGSNEESNEESNDEFNDESNDESNEESNEKSEEESNVESNEEFNEESNDGSNEESNEISTQKRRTEDKKSVNNPNEEYMKKQLIKAFGEELANKKARDASSEEEWDDDFFINKKVKKFKPTIVDIERLKDLKRKELANTKKNTDEEDL